MGEALQRPKLCQGVWRPEKVYTEKADDSSMRKLRHGRAIHYQASMGDSLQSTSKMESVLAAVGCWLTEGPKWGGSVGATSLGEGR